MAKKMCMLLAVALVLSCLTGCARQASIPAQTVPEPAEPRVVRVTETVTGEGKSLSIDAEVEVPDLTALEEITLCFDEALLDKMVTELVHSQYPSLEEGTMDGYRSWSVQTPEQLLFSFDCMDTGFDEGRVHYLDVLRDLNGQDVESDASMRWTPWYITGITPDKLKRAPEEASEEFCRFMEEYSCFDYETWNMVAVNCRREADASGYYQAMLHPRYAGKPVYIDGCPYISACMSAEGIFTFQGMMALKEQSRKPAEETMSLEEAVALLKEDFLTDGRSDAVTVSRITAGFVAESYYDETRVLSPAWIFESTRVSTRPDNGEEMVFYGTDVYKMSDGSHISF